VELHKFCPALFRGILARGQLGEQSPARISARMEIYFSFIFNDLAFRQSPIAIFARHQVGHLLRVSFFLDDTKRGTDDVTISSLEEAFSKLLLHIPDINHSIPESFLVPWSSIGDSNQAEVADLPWGTNSLVCISIKWWRKLLLLAIN
jgi:hypothetical protein